MKVLLTDIKNRKSFDVFNCLRRLDYELVLATETPTISDRCIYGQRVHELSKSSIDAFCGCLKSIAAQYGDEPLVFVPTEEDTISLFLESVKNCGLTGFRYALPDRKAFELARNKKLLSRFCHSHNFPSPREFSYDTLKQNFCRVVIKPSIGSGGSGQIYIDRIEDLNKLPQFSEEYLIQEQMPNPKEVEGGFFLFEKGRMVSYYGHKRIRTYPVKAGVTVYSKINFNDKIREVGAQLLQQLNWHGLAMVEFLLDPISNEYKIIEINPRLWGSFLLGEFAGAGFLRNYINISLDQEMERFVPRQDVTIRWVFPFDILNYIESRGQVRGFWDFDTSATCYIGFTFSTWRRSLSYICLNLFSLSKLKTLFAKILYRM